MSKSILVNMAFVSLFFLFLSHPLLAVIHAPTPHMHPSHAPLTNAPMLHNCYLTITATTTTNTTICVTYTTRAHTYNNLSLLTGALESFQLSPPSRSKNRKLRMKLIQSETVYSMISYKARSTLTRRVKRGTLRGHLSFVYTHTLFSFLS